jgi:threonine dehydratase
VTAPRSGAEAGLVTLAEVRAAARRIRGSAVRTPLLPAPWWPTPLWLKPESLQPTGAFKIRGAVNALAVLDPDVRARGVVTHSSGNHAQALARAARDAGVPAVVVMPDSTPVGKVEATRALRAEVHLVPVAERLARAEQLGAERGMVLVPPFDSRHVIAGQGTVGLEIVEDLPHVGTVVVPVSGAGLLSGVAVAVRALAPAARIVGVEPELAGDLAEGFALGRRVEWAPDRTARTVADGLRVCAVSELTWAHVAALVDDVVTVSEDAIRSAMRDLVMRARLVVEPSGAVALAALASGVISAGPGPAVAVVSGGNVDPALLRDVLGPL